MTNPLSTAPVDTPASVITVPLVLALFFLPVLFASVCFIMRFAGVRHPPYFAYFCAFGSLGALGLTITAANSPISVLGFIIAFLVSPFLLVRNFFALRSKSSTSGFHRAAGWVSLFSLLVIVLLLVWTLIDGYTSPSTRTSASGRGRGSRVRTFTLGAPTAVAEFCLAAQPPLHDPAPPNILIS